MNPINEIEDEKGQIDLGRFAARMYMGALQESKSTVVAFAAVAAFFAGSKYTGPDEEDKQPEDLGL